MPRGGIGQHAEPRDRSWVNGGLRRDEVGLEETLHVFQRRGVDEQRVARLVKRLAPREGGAAEQRHEEGETRLFSLKSGFSSLKLKYFNTGLL